MLGTCVYRRAIVVGDLLTLAVACTSAAEQSEPEPLVVAPPPPHEVQQCAEVQLVPTVPKLPHERYVMRGGQPLKLSVFSTKFRVDIAAGTWHSISAQTNDYVGSEDRIERDATYRVVFKSDYVVHCLAAPVGGSPP